LSEKTLKKQIIEKECYLMNSGLNFEKDYYVQSKTSNYEDYRKKKFSSLVDNLIDDLKLTSELKILDFGCATGGLIAEFKLRNFAFLKGTDISYWSIEYGRTNYDLENILEYYNLNLLTLDFDYVLFLDVLEHVSGITEIENIIKIVKANFIIVRIPVSKIEGDPYVLEVSRNDTTHVQCHTKEWWINIFNKYGFVLNKIFKTESIYDSEGVFAGVFENVK